MRLMICILLAWSVLSCTRPAQPEKPAAIGFGSGVVELHQPGSDHVTIRLMFQAGSVNDPVGKEGLTNLTASLMTEGGTQQYSKQELDEILYPLAVGFNAAVDKEVSVFSTTIHKDNLGIAYPLFRDLILNPRFDANDFERVKKDALKAVTQDIPNNNDEVFSKCVLDTIQFAGHPYQNLVEGTRSGLESITLEDVKAHFSRVFTFSNLMIGLAGGYDEAFEQQLVTDLKTLPPGTDNKVELPPQKSPNGVEARVVSKANSFGTAIFMGFPLEATRASDDFAALLVAASYLGEHRKSYGQLYKNMRTERSLNYGDYAYVEWYPAGHAVQLPISGTPRRHNFFSIWIRPVQIAAQFQGIEGLEPPELGNGVHSVRQPIRELEKLVDNGMTEEDFQRTRKFMRGYMKLYIQSQSDRLGFLMDSRFYGREDYIADMDSLLARLTRDDVNAVMKKYLQADNWYLSIITAESEATGLADALKNNTSAPIVYKPVVRAGLSEELLNEDKEIDAFKLNVTQMEVVPHDSLFQ